MKKNNQFYRGNLRSLITALSLATLLISCAFNQDKKANEQTSWQTFAYDFTALAEQSSFLAAELQSGNCAAIHAINAEQSLGVGSSFKLYVLAELAHQVATQTIRIKDQPQTEEYLSWNSLLPIQQKFKAIPGGSLLFVPDNTYFTVRYFAEQMIQRSDNTATDHLLFLLGREQVENRMQLAGHHQPELNIPLLSTREFAVLKFLYTDTELTDYRGLSITDKRTFLNQEQRGYQQLNEYFSKNGEQQKPVRIDTLEWFANRFDMCQILIALQQTAEQYNMPQVTEILSLEDPINVDREQWVYVGFKGGSELGVLAGNWLLQRNDGRFFIVSFALNNEQGAIDMQSVIPVLQSAVDLLGQTP